MHRSTGIGLVVCSAAACLLSGCALLPFGSAAGPRQPPVPLVDEVDDWVTLPHCPSGPETNWRLVDGFPVDALEVAGIAPECGDTWFDKDGEHFESVTEFRLDEAALDALDAALVADGYVELWDDFEPAAGGTAPRSVGARDYYLDGVHEGSFTRLALELYANGDDPQSYTAFIDYLSPETRALRP